MFRNETVIILGAGASWHYGYPTGEGLVECVITMALRFRDYCRARLECGQTVQMVPNYVQERMDSSKGISGANEAWAMVADECQLLVDRLQTVRPLVIDYFLGWNPALQPIGKLVIAAVILECEAIDSSQLGNQNRKDLLIDGTAKPYTDETLKRAIKKCKDDWYRFITHKLVMGCKKSGDIFSNNVRFITFNYDVSLEYRLSNALTAIDLLEHEDVVRFLSDKRIVHVYGSVHPAIPSKDQFVNAHVANILGTQFSQPLNFQTEFDSRKQFLDSCLEASNNLRTIDPHDKEDRAALKIARKWLESANVLYILGYGFDENNNKRIGLDDAFDQPA